MKQFSKNAIHAFEIHEDKVILTKPYELTSDDWKLIMTRFNRLGYGMPDLNTTIDTYTQLTIEGKKHGLGYVLQPDQANVVRCLLGKEQIKTFTISDELKAKAVKAAKEYFGTTGCMEFAGYLTADGDFLDFRYNGTSSMYRKATSSEAKCWGDIRSTQRDFDHRDVSDAFDEGLSDEDIAAIAAICLNRSEYNGAMDFFMNCGNIRLSCNGIDLIKEPSEAQYDKLYDYFEDLSMREPVVAIDFSNEDGKCIGTATYDMEHVPVMTLIRDIRDYYKTYELPQSKGFALESEETYER